MIVFPSSKINLGLRITEKRADGFHNLETVFYPVNIMDSLEVKGAETFRFLISGHDIPGRPEHNLCVQAFHLLERDYQISPVWLELIKHIPIGAGLGGGSSDAAFTIKLLNGFFKLKLSPQQMLDYAAQLGSDCAFFIRNEPVMATGRGEVMRPLQLDLSSYKLVIVKPNIHVSTQWAYGQIKPKKPRTCLAEVIARPIEDWKKQLVNDFENAVFKTFPEIKVIKQKLYHSGAVYASMSGSGSSVYGIFNDEIDLSPFRSYEFAWQGDMV